ncbi:MAG: hypothetical protein PVG49_08055 [Desulfobacteraceae bacterium]|jgi:hypothetical protein
MDLDALRKTRGYLRVVHHTRGRIRVKFDSAILKHPLAPTLTHPKTLKKLMETLPGIKKIRVNPGARSVIITYDPEILSPDRLQALFTHNDPDRLQQAIHEWTQLN